MTIPAFVIITALTTATVLLLWLATARARRIDHRSWRAWCVVLAAICAGLVVGLFYALFDYPVIWP